MKILLVLGGMLFLCWLYGKLIAILGSSKTQPKAIAPQVGYAYLLVFFFGFWAVLGSAAFAAYCTLLAPVVAIGVVQLWKLARRRRHRPDATPSFKPKIDTGLPYFLIGGVLVAAFAIWPYLLCGWGNYWQSGNEDIEDGLNGRDAYVDGLILDKRPDTGKILHDYIWQDFAKIAGIVPTRSASAEFYRETYAGDAFRFQYSSLAFWSVVFREPHGADIFLEQELTNLLLMFAGIYYLSRRAFLMSGAASAIAATVSVLSAFFLTTFFAGHEGSLMYGSLSPAVLYLALAKPEERLTTRATLAYLALIVLAIGFSYPHPLAILLPPIALYRLWTLDRFQSWLGRMRGFLAGRKARYVLAAVLATVILALGTVALWHVTAGYRLRQASVYRAWGFTHDPLIVPLFLGLVSSPIEGMRFATAILPTQMYWSLVAFAGLLAIALAACYARFRPAANPGFLPLFGLCCIPLYLVFRYFIVDSYYLYKFLYTHQYLLIVGLVGFFTTTRRRLLQFGAGAVLLVNLVSDFGLARNIYGRPYNHESAEMAKLLQVDPGILRGSFIEILGGEGVAVRQALKAHHVETSRDPRFATYFIVPADQEPDITGSQLSQVVAAVGTRLLIVRGPAVNYLMARAWNRPEWGYSDLALRRNVFRWVASGKGDELGIYVIRPSRGDDAQTRYLRICMQAGPSAKGIIPVTVTGRAQAVLARVALDGMRCLWIPSEAARTARQPLVLHSGVQGRSLLPHDDRILLYRVFAVGWTGETYDEHAMSLFNMDQDITSPAAQASGNALAVRLGQGWQPFETYGGASFRWAGRSPEIVLPGGTTGGFADVALDLEPGPSYGGGPFHLTVEDNEGHALFESAGISGREVLHPRLPYRAGGPTVYVLRSNGRGLLRSDDPRELDFRVFHIVCSRSGD
jgi:hypothetical protein